VLVGQCQGSARGAGMASGHIMRVVRRRAPRHGAAEGLATATTRYRGGIALVAQRLGKLGALREGIDAEEARGILWFYFGYAGFFTLVDENGWSYAKAEQWLHDAASHDLF
jgi:hypothetical protein